MAQLYDHVAYICIFSALNISLDPVPIH